MFGERPPVPHLTIAGYHDYGWALKVGAPDLESNLWAGFRGDMRPDAPTLPIDTATLGTSDDRGACPFPMYFQAPASPPRRCDGYHFWSFHPGGGHFTFADGSVRFMTYGSGPTTVLAMSTRNQGEVFTE
jgi:prepilin-type processing-associated H-X9-DG protein